jgi:hypothetical protein
VHSTQILKKEEKETKKTPHSLKKKKNQNQNQKKTYGLQPVSLANTQQKACR